MIDYNNPQWPSQILNLCKEHRTGNGKKGVNVVYDPVGLIDPSLKCVAWNARLVVVGFTGGRIEKLALNRVLLKNVSVMGLHWGEYSKKEPETVEVVWKGIFDMIESGKFKSIVFRDKEYNRLEKVPEALKDLGARETWGKVVVGVDGADSTKPKL